MNKYFGLLSIIFFSCTNNTAVKQARVENKNGTYTDINYILRNKDTVLDGIIRTYSHEGVLLTETTYKNNLKEGWEKVYDFSGKMLSNVFFKDNIMQGEAQYYYPDGRISANVFYLDGKPVFSKGLWKNDIPITYNIFRRNGFVQYVVLFDSTNTKFYENGFIFDDSLQYLNDVRPENLKVNSEVEAKIFTTNLPGYSRSVLLYYFDEKGNKIPISSEVADSGFYTFIKFKPYLEGRHTIALLGELRDEKNTVVKKDTFISKINVSSIGMP